MIPVKAHPNDELFHASRFQDLQDRFKSRSTAWPAARQRLPCGEIQRGLSAFGGMK